MVRYLAVFTALFFVSNSFASEPATPVQVGNCLNTKGSIILTDVSASTCMSRVGGNIISSNGQIDASGWGFVGRWSLTVVGYECNNPDYPILNGDDCESDTIIICSDGYFANKNGSEGTLSQCDRSPLVKEFGCNIDKPAPDWPVSPNCIDFFPSDAEIAAAAAAEAAAKAAADAAQIDLAQTAIGNAVAQGSNDAAQAAAQAAAASAAEAAASAAAAQLQVNNNPTIPALGVIAGNANQAASDAQVAASAAQAKATDAAVESIRANQTLADASANGSQASQAAAAASAANAALNAANSQAAADAALATASTAVSQAKAAQQALVSALSSISNSVISLAESAASAAQSAASASASAASASASAASSGASGDGGAGDGGAGDGGTGDGGTGDGGTGDGGTGTACSAGDSNCVNTGNGQPCTITSISCVIGTVPDPDADPSENLDLSSIEKGIGKVNDNLTDIFTTITATAPATEQGSFDIAGAELELSSIKSNYESFLKNLRSQASSLITPLTTNSGSFSQCRDIIQMNGQTRQACFAPFADDMKIIGNGILLIFTISAGFLILGGVKK
jgi:hypothetical protein